MELVSILSLFVVLYVGYTCYVVDHAYEIRFVAECNPEYERCFLDECASGDTSCYPYKYQFVRVASMRACPPEGCAELVCENDSGCTTLYCSEASLEFLGEEYTKCVGHDTK